MVQLLVICYLGFRSPLCPLLCFIAVLWLFAFNCDGSLIRTEHICNFKLHQNLWRSCKSCFTHCSLETPKRVIVKQCRPRSDAAKRGVWPGSPLFADSVNFLSEYPKKSTAASFLFPCYHKPWRTRRMLDGLGGSVGWASDWWSGGCGFDPAGEAVFFRGDWSWNIFSAILSLPLSQERQLSVSSERMCTNTG